MRPAQSKGLALRGEPNRSARRQRVQRSGYHTAIESEGGIGGAFGASKAFAPKRSGGRRRGGLPALRACPKVPTRSTRMGLAIFVPFNAFEPGPKVGQNAPPPCQRNESAAGGEGRGAAGWNREARQLSFSAPFVRDAASGIRLRYPNCSGITRAQRREHHADLHPCDAEAG